MSGSEIVATEDCDHPNVDWDWGDTRPARKYIVVPGYCPDCETSLERHYTFKNVSVE
jgi:hypothetical protein